MFYEESYTNGVLWFRTTPNGEWTIASSKQEVAYFRRQLEESTKLITEQQNAIANGNEIQEAMSAEINHLNGLIQTMVDKIKQTGVHAEHISIIPVYQEMVQHLADVRELSVDSELSI